MAPINKLRRILQLIDILQSGRQVTTAQLADESGVSRRTVFRDLAALRDCGVDIVFDERQQTLRLPRRSFVMSTELTEEEILSLAIFGRNLCKEGTGLPFLSPTWSAVQKIVNGLPSRSRELLRVADAVVIELAPHKHRKEGVPTLQLFLKAIATRCCVRIEYSERHEGRSCSTLVSPFRLVFRHHGWYVIGRSSLHRDVRAFDVCRISNAEIVDRPFVVPPRFCVDRFFNNAWCLDGETGNRQHVLIRFLEPVASEVTEIRWHPTQKVQRNSDGTIDFQVEVNGLEEISQWILSYGSHVKVLAPEELRNMIAGEAAQTIKLYETVT